MTSPRVATRLGAVPLPVLAVAIVVLNFVLPPRLGPGSTFELPYLNAILFTLLVFATSSAVAYISFKSYLQDGSVILLLLGSGALAWGSAALLGNWLLDFTGGPNIGLTIINSGALFASILHVVGATMTSRASHYNKPSRRKSFLVLAYGGVLSFTIVFTILSLEGMVPPFFVPGVGQTPLRMAVLGSAAALFAISSLLFARVYSPSKSSILYWYFLALGMTSVGLAALFFLRAAGDPIFWTGRAALCLGGVYFLKAVLTTFRGAHGSGEPVPTHPAGQ